MKLTWNKISKKRPLVALSNFADLPFEHNQTDQVRFQSLEEVKDNNNHELEAKELAEFFKSQGDKLAEEGKYKEALMKWEASLNLVSENAVLHEQKSQVLLELGDTWKALVAATRATEIDPSWPEAWTTLGRAQLNFGEPDSAIKSFENALSINADLEEAKEDLQTAKQLIKKREQVESSGQDSDNKRFLVGEKNIEPR